MGSLQAVRYISVWGLLFDHDPSTWSHCSNPGTATRCWTRRLTRAWRCCCRSWCASRSVSTRRTPPRPRPRGAWSWGSGRSPSTWSCRRSNVSSSPPTARRSSPKVGHIVQLCQMTKTFAIKKKKKDGSPSSGYDTAIFLSPGILWLFIHWLLTKIYWNLLIKIYWQRQLQF